MMRGSASKKALFATEQDRPDVARKRWRWKTHQGRLDPTRLVFIDETWAKTNMTRLREAGEEPFKARAVIPNASRTSCRDVRTESDRAPLRSAHRASRRLPSCRPPWRIGREAAGRRAR